MSETVNLPALGESVTEGTVTRWLKNVGDHIDVDEPLLEVSTDKVDTEIPSPISGVLEEIFAQEDDTIDVGAPLAKVGDGSGTSSNASAPAEEGAAGTDESASAGDDEKSESEAESSESEPAQEDSSADAETESDADSAEEPAPTSEESASEPDVSEDSASESDVSDEPAQPSSSTSNAAQPEPIDVTGNAGYVTPLVRRLAHQHNVDISTVTGTGVGGRIRKEDVLEAAAGASAPASAAPAPASVSNLRGTRQPMSRLRKVAAEQAVTSRQATAQVTSVVEADVTAIVSLVERVQDRYTEKTGMQLALLPFFAQATTRALQAFPIINATVDGDDIVYPGAENLSVAIDTDRGLLTPVIKNAGSLDVAGLATSIDDLTERTRSNTLGPDELSGGTFTIASSDERGVLIETPLVFLPQSAALNVGEVVKRPVIVDSDGVSAIAIRSVAYLSLSYDQRIIDSTDAARFLDALTGALAHESYEEQLGL